MKNDLKAELNQLYRKWPVVRKYLKDLGCRGAAAEDIFQEALCMWSKTSAEYDYDPALEEMFKK